MTKEIARRLEENHGKETSAPQEENREVGSADPLSDEAWKTHLVRHERLEWQSKNRIEPEPEGLREQGAFEPNNPEPFCLFPEDADDEDMDHLGLMQAGMPKEVARDFMNIYEILLVQGAPKDTAEQKVSELFSLPRITAEIRRVPNLMLDGGSTNDLMSDKNGKCWDFRRAADRQRVRTEIQSKKPYMVIGSPPCAVVSSLMTFNKNRMGKKRYDTQLREGRQIIEFCRGDLRAPSEPGKALLA